MWRRILLACSTEISRDPREKEGGLRAPGEGLVVSTNEIEDQRLEIRNRCEEVVARGEVVPKARESFSS